MNTRIRSVLIIIGILTLIVIGIIVIPRGLSLYYQTKGGQQVEYVLRTSEGIHELACEQLSPADEEGSNEVEQAFVDLNRAIMFNKNNAQAYYYLGKANCLLGEPEEAKENYLQYTELRPDNPLGYIGLGFAYEESGDLSYAKSAWKSASINPEEFSNIGNAEFRAEKYENALNWYERSELLDGKQSAYSKFNWSVATILSGNQFPTHLDPLTIPVYQVSGALTIEGDQLQWFRPEDNYWNIHYGQVLSEHPTGDPGVGGIWWEGAAVAILHLPCTANYNIQVRATHNRISDEVGQLQITRNLTPIAVYSLSDDWLEYETDMNLTEGYHLIGINYAKDVGDAFVNWLKVNQISDCEP